MATVLAMLRLHLGDARGFRCVENESQMDAESCQSGAFVVDRAILPVVEGEDDDDSFPRVVSGVH